MKLDEIKRAILSKSIQNALPIYSMELVSRKQCNSKETYIFLSPLKSVSLKVVNRKDLQ